MDGLKEWVRHLVLLVLLATCLDLLLPMNSMKKYVRMTMGLLVVLAVTRPIVGLLGQPITVDTTLFAPPSDKHLPTLNQIMAEAKQFREKNQALATHEARQALAAEAVRAAKAVPGVADARAAVEVHEVDGQQQIRSVTVTVVPGTAGSVRPVEPVRPVQPVQSVGPSPSGGAAPAVAAQPAPREPAAGEEKALAESVRREVGARLGLTADPRLVQVLVEQTAQTQRR